MLSFEEISLVLAVRGKVTLSCPDGIHGTWFFELENGPNGTLVMTSTRVREAGQSWHYVDVARWNCAGTAARLKEIMAPVDAASLSYAVLPDKLQGSTSCPCTGGGSR